MKRLTLLLSNLLYFLFAVATLVAAPVSKEQEAAFLGLMRSQMATILAKPDVNKQFLDIQPLADGGPSFINSVYLVTTTEGEELILKIGNPIWKGSKTLNEVTALKFLNAHTSVPVPSVCTFSSSAEQSPIGKEYILMPRVKGLPLSSEIHRIYQNKAEYHHLLDQLAAILAELKSLQFSQVGNFTDYQSESHLLQIGGIVDFAGYEVKEPCYCYSDYAKHCLSYYVQEMELLVKKGSPDSKLYQHYIPILNELLAECDFSCLDRPHDTFVFSHQDFVMKNILVDGSTVTAVLDWEWSGSALMEIESMTGLDFLLSEEDRLYFDQALRKLGIAHFFEPPPKQRELFYRFIGNVYSLVAFREWREGKLEHTAKFLSQKLEQRKIRNNPNFDSDLFIQEISRDFDFCIAELKNQ